MVEGAATIGPGRASVCRIAAALLVCVVAHTGPAPEARCSGPADVVAPQRIASEPRRTPTTSCPPDLSVCPGDCNGDGQVSVDEVVRGVNIVLGQAEIGSCRAADPDGNGDVTVEELVVAVRQLLYGCTGVSHADFLVRACEGETFVVRIADPELIAQARRIADGLEPQRIVTGRLRCGDGGFNLPWSWHLDPQTVQLAEVAIELCDGCPSFVEMDLAYWLGIGIFCPWSSEIVQEIRP